MPVGSYTRTVLASCGVRELEDPRERAHAGARRGRHRRKLAQGAVDAGFVYVSDVRATDGKLKAIELRRRCPDFQPTASRSSSGAKNEDAAKAFVARAAGRDGKQRDDAGFEPPPAQ